MCYIFGILANSNAFYKTLLLRSFLQGSEMFMNQLPILHSCTQINNTYVIL